jgi:hypothetical protein
MGSAPPQSNNDERDSTELHHNSSSSTSTAGIKAFFNDGGNCRFHYDYFIHQQKSSLYYLLPTNLVFPDNLILETELLTGAIKSLLADLQQPGTNDANAVFHSDSVEL